MTGILIKRGNLDTDMCTRKASGEDWKYAARSKELAEARREAWNRPFPVLSDLFQCSWERCTLISDFQPPELETTLQPLSLWYFVSTA